MKIKTLLLSLMTFISFSIIAQTGNVGIGTTSPDTTLHVVGNLKIEDGNQGSSKVLTSDVNGVASWQTFMESDPSMLVDSLNIVPRWDGTNLVNGTMLDNGTNIGIGILNPGRKLDVSGDIGVNGLLIGKGLANHNSNTVVGFNALKVNTNGLGTTAFGNAALEFSDANFNTGFGYRALNLTTTGSQNVALGPALGANIIGSNNVGIGFQALEKSNSSNNTSVGTQSLRDLTTGIGNTSVGNLSLENNMVGDNNVAVGIRSGQNNLGSANVFLGNQAGMNDTTSNKLYIENSDSPTPLIYGDFANDTVKVFGTLNIGDNYSFPTTDGTDGQLMSTDGNGEVNWEDAPTEVLVDSLNIVPRWDGSNLVNGTMVDDGTNIGIGVVNPIKKLEVSEDILVYGITLGRGNGNIISNTTIGSAALLNNTSGESNSILGYRAMQSNTAGWGNTVMGSEALKENTIGSINTAIGSSAMQFNIDGIKNTAIGNSALRFNIGGYLNVAIGNHSMEANTTGFRNAALGTRSMFKNTIGVENVAMGDESMYENLEGSANAAYGEQALYYNTTGNSNTAIGNSSMFGNITGSSNTSLGQYADVLSPDLNNATAIGAGAKVATSNSLVLGASNVSVGIGTSSPQAKLDVTEDIMVDQVIIGRRGTSNNMVVGEEALDNISTGQYNTAVGKRTLQQNDIGAENTAVGHDALKSNTGGGQNTGIGLGALAVNTGSSGNTAVGYTALAESTGGGNTAVGSSAMVDLLTGTNNVAVGNGVMGGLGAGSGNTAVGYNSGSLAIGSGNIFLGHRAGFNETGNDKLYIDNSDTTNPLIYGDFDTDEVKINGTINISETAKLTPLATAPGCAAGDAGLLYFDDTLNKLRVCDGTAWQNLH